MMMPSKVANKMSGASGKQISKDKKKQIQKGLDQAWKMSRDGQIAAFRDGDFTHIIIREDKMNEGLQNVQKGLGFIVDPPKELLEFNKIREEVLTVMSKLNYSELSSDQFDTDEDYQEHLKIVNRNRELFNEIDQFTFDTQQAMMGTKAQRKKISDEYKEFRKDHPEIDEIVKSRVQGTVV